MPDTTADEKEARRQARAEAKAQREREELEEEQRIQSRRRDQLLVASTAKERVRGELRDLRRNEAARAALADHLGGFYGEVDKLAKGKAIMEATDMVVEEANQILRDTKGLVTGDPFLDRLKEFVPAGENPLYSDVLISLRSLRQVLGRAATRLKEEIDSTKRVLRSAVTVEAALDLLLNHQTHPTKDDVEADIAPHSAASWWFVGSDEEFDFDRLDSIDLAATLTVTAAVDQ